MDAQTLYQKAIVFATNKHLQVNHNVTGTDMPYVVHLSNVTMEILMAAAHTPKFNLEFAVQVALLHDTIEDTSTTRDELAATFGEDVANAVAALSKNGDLQKEQQMADSLNRIKQQPKEVWAVKLADRITNLQPPPAKWDKAKKQKYHDEAGRILSELGAANAYLADRLKKKIIEYSRYVASQCVNS